MRSIALPLILLMLFCLAAAGSGESNSSFSVEARGINETRDEEMPPEEKEDEVNYELTEEEIILDWGEKPTSGFHIKITNVDFKEEKGLLIVDYLLIYPIKEPVLQVITYPEDSARLPVDKEDIEKVFLRRAFVPHGTSEEEVIQKLPEAGIIEVKKDAVITEWGFHIEWSADNGYTGEVPGEYIFAGVYEIELLSGGNDYFESNLLHTSDRSVNTVVTVNYPYGDVGGTGDLEVSDAILVLRHVVGLTDLADVEKYDAYTYDRAVVSGEDELSVKDAIMILQRVVGLNDTFPVEQIK